MALESWLASVLSSFSWELAGTLSTVTSLTPQAAPLPGGPCWDSVIHHGRQDEALGYQPASPTTPHATEATTQFLASPACLGPP